MIVENSIRVFAKATSVSNILLCTSYVVPTRGSYIPAMFWK